MKRKRMPSEKSAPQYAELIEEHYRAKSPIERAEYAFFLHAQSTTTPGSRGYPYHLALKRLAH